MIASLINILNLPVTPTIQTVIDVQIQAEETKLQATNAQLVVQTQQLNNTISTLKSTVNSI